MAEPGGSAIQLVGAYLQSKGMPMTADNVRRALQLNANNPGTIKGLVNGAAEDSNPAPTMRKAPTTTKPRTAPTNNTVTATAGTKPTARSDAAASATAPMNSAATATTTTPPVMPSNGNRNLLTSLVELILGGGAGALGGLAGGRALQGDVMPPRDIVPYNGQGAAEPPTIDGQVIREQLKGPGQQQLPAPPLRLSAPPPQVTNGTSLQLPAPPMQLPAPMSAPQANQPSPLNLLPDEYVNNAMPAEMRNIDAPPANNPSRVGGAAQTPTAPAIEMMDAAHMMPVGKPGMQMLDWGKILGEVAGAARRLRP